MRPAPCQVARPDATSRRDVCRREEEKWGFPRYRHPRERMRNRAQGLNLLARGFLTWPETKFLFRQRCAAVRRGNTGLATQPLTVTVRPKPEHPVPASTKNSLTEAFAL